MFDRSIVLNNGVKIPQLGLGTWFIDDDKAADAVKAAVEIGYRHIDTAQAYGNERGVGEGVRTCGIPRNELFVVSKVAAEHKTYEEAMAGINETLEKMGLDYLDMMIIHSPQPWAKVNQCEDRYIEGNRAAWKALEDAYKAGKLKAIITQNIDGLHQAAGSKNVYEIHGSIHRNYCQKCGKFYDAAYVKNSKGVPHCECGGVIKPDVVLYEESLDENMIDKSIRAISQADTLIIGGTSLVVYPAAGFVDYFRGKHLVVINKSETAKSVRAELTIAAPIGEVLSQITV